MGVVPRCYVASAAPFFETISKTGNILDYFCVVGST